MYPWLHLGPFAISTYSLLFLCAFIVGGIVTYYEAKRLNRATEAILRVALGALAGGLIGAKLSMLLFLGPATFIKDLPYLWYSGQAWTGAFFGGYIAVLLVKRFSHIKYSTFRTLRAYPRPPALFRDSPSSRQVPSLRRSLQNLRCRLL